MILKENGLQNIKQSYYYNKIYFIIKMQWYSRVHNKYFWTNEIKKKAFYNIKFNIIKLWALKCIVN